jgi:hypothetical protein
MSVDFAPDEISHITPTADPSMITEMQVLLRAQFLMELAAHPALGPLLPKMDAMKQILRAAKENDLVEKLQEPSAMPDPVTMAKAADLTASAQKKGMETQLAAAKVDQVHSGIVEAGFKMRSGAHSGVMSAAEQAHKIALATEEASRAPLNEAKAHALEAHTAQQQAHGQAHQGAMELMRHEHDTSLAERQHQLERDRHQLERDKHEHDKEMARKQAKVKPAKAGA